MNKRQRPSRKKRGATVAAVLCFVAAIAIVGTYTFNDYKETQRKEELARAEETNDTKEKKTKEPSEEANNLVISNQADTDTQENTADEGTGTNETETAAQEHKRQPVAAHP